MRSYTYPDDPEQSTSRTIRRWIDRVFPHEEINGKGRCPTYLHRWTLGAFGSVRIYLHHFVASDWSRDLHDHPKRFFSIGLWGSYREERAVNPGAPNERRVFVRYRAPWIRTFRPEHTHRLFLPPGGSCWTLVVTLWAVRQWGFWPNGKWVHWRRYITSEAADDARDC